MLLSFDPICDGGGVRRAQLKLAALYLSESRDDFAKMLREVIVADGVEKNVQLCRDVILRARLGT